jgi:ERCC4-type nuclease
MTNNRILELLNSVTIIVDTRENENSHITNYFDKNNIKYIYKKLDYGDYSFVAPIITELSIYEGISFEKRLTIERKSGLDELSGNIAQNRERFENEFIRCNNDKAKMVLMVEDGSYEKILKHDYRTSLLEKSYIASLFTFVDRYGIDLQFIPGKLAGWFIYNRCRYFFREELKNLTD